MGENRHRLRFTGTATQREFDEAVKDTYWYHSFYFDNGFEVRGDYDIGANIGEYGFPATLAGSSVLDIGAGSGWFSVYFEQLGAEVTAVDIWGRPEIDRFGVYRTPARPISGEVTEMEDAVGLTARSGGIMAGLLDSQITRRHASVYELHPDLFGGKRFDLVFMGALLLHLRDPIGALMAARSVCAERLIATNWFIPDDGLGTSVVDMPYGAEAGATWWRPSPTAQDRWLRGAGFRTVDVSRTVTLTADVVDEGHRNPTQVLLLADATV